MTTETIGNTKMSIEQKAKAYDEALEKAKKQLEDAKVFDYKEGQIAYDIRTTTYAIFPELKESKDEKVRKELLAVINDLVLPEEQQARFNAWLERQKEQEPEAKLTGWVARDKDTEMLNFYMDCPPRRDDFWAAPASLHLPDKGFPDIKWEDEPIEIEVTITKK